MDINQLKEMSNSKLNEYISELDNRIHAESQINVPSEHKYMQDINRFKIRYPDHEIERAVGYLFFTKPDLNIVNDSGEVLDSASDLSSIRDILRSKDIILAQSLKSNYGPRFINLLSTYAENLDVQDISMKPRQSAETSNNWKIMYGFRTTESKAANTISISYTDDRNLSVYKLHKIWVDYIDAVSMGILSPKREYVLKRIIDYASSLYYFLVAEDGKTILYYAKFTGIFPTNIPESAFGWSKGDESKLRNFQVQYQYSFFDAMNPLIIQEFNGIAGSTENLKEAPIFNTEIGLMGPTWVKKAKIEETHHNGVFSGYKLRFYI